MWWPFNTLLTSAEFEAAMKKINNTLARMELQMALTQADIDALGQQVDQVSADLSNSIAAVQAELDALANANPTLDLSGVTSKVAALDVAVQAVAGLVPDAPA